MVVRHDRQRGTKPGAHASSRSAYRIRSARHIADFRPCTGPKAPASSCVRGSDTTSRVRRARGAARRAAGSRYTAGTGAIRQPRSPVERSRAIDYLDATSVAGRRFDEWDAQMLGLASQLAAFVLEVERLRAPRPVLVTNGTAPPLIGSTSVMRALRQRIERVADRLHRAHRRRIGTGKELVARQVHEISRRRYGPFVAVNCAALVESLLEAELFGIEERTATGVRGRRGKFEHADGGTLFLDEVSDLSPAAQAKLLRAIQDLAVERVGGQGSHTVDIRIVAATNRSLRGMVASGAFRADLFYRLSGVELQVPPLRARQPRHPGARRSLPRAVSRLARLDCRRQRATRCWRITGRVTSANSQRVIEGIVALTQNDHVLDRRPADGAQGRF